MTRERRTEEDTPARSEDEPRATPAHELLELQRTAGNQAVSRYLQRTRTERRGRAHQEKARTQHRQSERDAKPLRHGEPEEEPEQEPEEIDEGPSEYDTAYEAALNAFATRTAKMDFSHSGMAPRFDKRYWTCTLVVHRKRKPKLERVPYTGNPKTFKPIYDSAEDVDFEYTLKSGVMPHVAIQALYQRGDLWAMDCIDYVVAARLYAECIAKGDFAFDWKYLDLGGLLTSQPMKMAQHDTPGLTGKGLWRRERQGGEFRLEGDGTGHAPANFADEDELLSGLPVGARVMWTNSFDEGDPDMENENTIKLGPDLYAAHPFGPSSAERIRKKLIVDEVDGPDDTTRKLSAAEQRAQATEHIYLAEVELYDRD